MKNMTEINAAGLENSGRRHFLKSSALLTGALAATSVLGLLAPSLSWALPLQHLDQADADAVLALAKTLYPHKDLPDAVYALVVKELDVYAGDTEGRNFVAKGVAALNAKASGHFSKASRAGQRRAVASLIDDGFVQKVRGTCITSLYNNDMAFAHFGYEGEAFSKGGYVHRGFNDLSWLPAPPSEASPALKS
jgi:hypothetical protein